MTVYSVKKPPSSNQNMVQGSPFWVLRYLASLEGGSPSSQLLHLRGRGWLWGNITPTAETIFPVMRGPAQVLTVTPHQRRGASLSSGMSALYLPFIGSRHRSCSWNTAQLSSSIKEKTLLHGKTSWNVHLGLPAVYMCGQLCNYNTHDDSEHRSQQPSSQGQRRCVNPTSGRPVFSEPRSPQVPAW